MREKVLSRPLATAATLAAHAGDVDRFPDKQVLLTGSKETLSTGNGRECLLAAVRLLPRICPNLVVCVPPGCEALVAECNDIIKHIGIGGLVEVTEGRAREAHDAALVVGVTAGEFSNATVINSNGWVARVCSTGQSIDAQCDNFNPVGALAAASLGVSEVFKRLLTVKDSRGPLFPSTAFSLLRYSVGCDEPNPTIPALPEVNLALFGAGAIGNGIAYLLRRLRLRGQIAVVDPQAFGEENVGTCILIGIGDVGAPKARFLAEGFDGGLKVLPYGETIQDFGKRLGSERDHPSVVLNGLDDIDPRHDAQDLWPDVVIDGAIGTFECQASAHPWGPDIGCLRCLFVHPTRSAELVAVAATGLRAGRVGGADNEVTADDVQAAPESKKEWLRQQIGRKICSVVSDGVARQISDANLSENFRPSVPFVATMSAAMVVTELVRVLAGWEPVIDPGFQFDLLRGPAQGQRMSLGRKCRCLCVRRQKSIEMVRNSRARPPLA